MRYRGTLSCTSTHAYIHAHIHMLAHTLVDTQIPHLQKNMYKCKYTFTYIHIHIHAQHPVHPTSPLTPTSTHTPTRAHELPAVEGIISLNSMVYHATALQCHGTECPTKMPCDRGDSVRTGVCRGVYPQATAHVSSRSDEYDRCFVPHLP